MSKPIQIIFLSLVFISACASNSAINVQPNPKAPSAKINQEISGKNAGLHQVNIKDNTNINDETKPNKLQLKPLQPNENKITNIRSGKSINSADGFLNADGSLKPDILEFAQEVSNTKRLPHEQVIRLIKSAQYNEKASRLMTPSKTRIRKSWVTYKNRFVEPIRIKAGLEFWQNNYTSLKQTEEKFGVDAAIIVAIIGVETIYGRYMGDFKVLDALATLGFRYPDDTRPERSQMFRNQLADLIYLHFNNKLDANTVTGSFAGAMGLPQFMPTSLLNYAVDGNNDGRIDLTNNSADAIASVASFLRHHGWQPNLKVFIPASLPQDVDKLVTGKIDPSYTWEQLQSHGISSTSNNLDWQSHLLGIVDLIDEPRNMAEYRLATPNFFAITHYNRSYFYASAVYELAQELRLRMN